MGPLGRTALVATLAIALAGCGALPTSPPPLPDSFVPEATQSPPPTQAWVSFDGFSAVESVALRVRASNCEQFVNGSAWALDATTAVTNRHVIEGAVSIELTTHDGRDIRVTESVLAGFADLALLTIDGEFPHVARIAEEAPSVGEELSVVGYPRGGRLITTTGPYQATVDETIGEDQDPVYVVSAAAEQGSSGSPVANAAGEVVGVLYAASESDVSYAVTWDSLQTFVSDTSTHQPNPPGCER